MVLLGKRALSSGGAMSPIPSGISQPRPLQALPSVDSLLEQLQERIESKYGDLQKAASVGCSHVYVSTRLRV